VFAFSCEGYKGVSQSAGHHIANNQVFRHLVGQNDQSKEGEYKISLLGEYNIGGDGFEIDRILNKCGIRWSPPSAATPPTTSSPAPTPQI
jgi:nitrogenase molybdenum-iron protein alpha chain